MSDGGAGALAKMLEIPILREITLFILWYWSLSYSIAHRDAAVFGFTVLTGLAGAAVFWFLYNRKRSDSGGGFKLVVVVVLMLVLFPLLIWAWMRRKHA